MRHRVVFAPEARDDLIALYLHIAQATSEATAMAYVARIEAFCGRFDLFPERGTKRDDLFPGLRVIGFEGRVVIAFHVSEGEVVIDRVLYGGRDLGVLA